MRLANNVKFTMSLMKASPAFKLKLPRHSTGSFRVQHPYFILEEEAREYFDENFALYAERLGYPPF